MNDSEFWDIYRKNEAEQAYMLTDVDALDFLDHAQRLKLPLSDIQMRKVSAALDQAVDDGNVREVQQYGNRHRFIVRKKGTQLPMESGDTTP